MSSINPVNTASTSYTLSLRHIPKNLARIVGVATVIFAMASLRRAEAGPAAYAACVSICTAGTLGGFLPLCLASCAPFLAAPTP